MFPTSSPFLRQPSLLGSDVGLPGPGNSDASDLRSSWPSLKRLQAAVAMRQPWFYLRLVPIAFLGCPRGHTVARETVAPNPPKDTHPRTRALSADGLHDESALRRAARSSCLWLQMLRVEGFSFLPDPQRDGGDLARQGQPRHLRLHVFGQQPLVEPRNGPCTRWPQWPHP